ncbi:MAG TPA: hypothetical protein VN837_05505 [Chloroflexota bacterium]|nr:hypothetical protein [Chloroflexota bacterium]
MNCTCRTCDRCRAILTEDTGHQHVSIGDQDDNLRLALCRACLRDLERKLDIWKWERP